MNVVFEDRNTIAKLLPPSPVRVWRYSRTAVGGCKEAELVAQGDAAQLLNWLSWLRRKAYIANDQGTLVWWGYISRVEVSYQRVTVSVDTETMANRVAVAYTTLGSGQSSVGMRGTTGWVEDADSISEYGRKELLLSKGGTTAAVALINRDRSLAENKYPTAQHQTGERALQATATIYCAGWWSTLSWRYAAVPTDLALAYTTIGSLAKKLGETANAIAQSFDTGSIINLQEIAVFARRVGNPADNLRLAVHANPDDLTPGEQLDAVNIPGASIGTEAVWVKASLSSPLILAANATYFLVVDRSGAASLTDYYELVLDEWQGYGAGIAREKTGSAWGPGPEGDLPFMLYDNTLVETGQQVASLITNYGQFLRRVEIQNPSGIASPSYRNGDSDTQYEVEELLLTGTTNQRRLLAEVDPDRNVRIWEQPTSHRPYLIDDQARVYAPEGQPIEPGDCPAGIWLAARDLLETVAIDRVNGLAALFVEEMEYDAETGTLRYQSAGARDPWDFGTQEG